MPPVVLVEVRNLEELVGSEIVVTDWLQVTQERIQEFAELTDDRQWIHVDADRAKRESPYGATVAHGFLILSLLSCLMKRAVKLKTAVNMGINYGLNRVRFPAPVRAGQNIRARFTLQSCKKISDGREAVFSVTVEVENSEKPCCVAEWVVRYYF